MKKFLENNTGLLALAGVGGYLLYKLRYGTFSEVLGVKGAEQQNTVVNSVFAQIEKDPAVKPQLKTIGNLNKAEALYKAMNHMGTDEASIKTILKSISGPNQMKAVYHAYGIRTLYALGIPYNEGDLFYHLLIELGRSEYDKFVVAPFETWMGLKY